MANPNENHRLEARSAEFVGDHPRKFEHVIAESSGPELAEVRQVLAQLRRLYSGAFGEHLAGNGLDVIVFESREAAQVGGQSVDCLSRDFWTIWLFQGRSNRVLG